MMDAIATTSRDLNPRHTRDRETDPGGILPGRCEIPTAEGRSTSCSSRGVGARASRIRGRARARARDEHEDEHDVDDDVDQDGLIGTIASLPKARRDDRISQSLRIGRAGYYESP
jgi:hypothetical protein